MTSSIKPEVHNEHVIKMADENVVLCDVLCFLVNKFGKVATKTIKGILSDFYSVDKLAAAKSQLVNDIDKLNLSPQRPYVPTRRDGDGRLANETEDIIKLFDFLDDQKSLNRLPLYVSSSPDNMPSIRLYDGDLCVLMSIIRDMGGRLDKMESVMAAIFDDIHNRPSLPVSIPGPTAREPQGQRPTGQSRDQHQQAQPQPLVCQQQQQQVVIPENRESRSCDDNTDRSWANAASTPFVHGNRFSVLASATDDDDEEAQQPYTTVQPRRNKRMRQRSSPQAATQQQTSLPGKRPGARILMGKSTATSSNVSAANKLRKKRVLCVDNVNSSCSVENLVAFLASLSVVAISCFEVKSRRRRNESNMLVNADRKAFRLCIFEDDFERILNPDVWPDSVVISEWFFKQAGTTRDKKRRTDSVHDSETELKDVDETIVTNFREDMDTCSTSIDGN